MIRAMPIPDPERFRAYLERELAQTRRIGARQRDMRRLLLDNIEEVVRRNSRRRPPGMASALVEPPRGPKPLQGGAAAPLEFD